MISDTLFDAILEMEEYLKPPFRYGADEPWIRSVIAQMKALQMHLDRCPIPSEIASRDWYVTIPPDDVNMNELWDDITPRATPARTGRRGRRRGKHR